MSFETTIYGRIVGATFKELVGDMPTWLGKFEAVLRRLF